MRERSGRVAAVMVGSAVALALSATPLAVDWTSLKIEQKQAEAKDGGGKGGGEGKGGDKGGKGGKGKGGDRGRGGKDSGAGSGAADSNADSGGSAADHNGRGSADDGNEPWSVGGGSEAPGDGSGAKASKNKNDDGDGGSQAADAGSVAGSAEGEVADNAEDADAELDDAPAETQTAAASAAPDQVPVKSALPFRTGPRSPVATRRVVTVPVKTIRGRPPRDRSAAQIADAQIRLAPVISAQIAALAATACAAEAIVPICPPVAAPAAVAPPTDLAPAAIHPAAGPVADPPPAAPDHPGQVQLTYAVPKTVVEPEPRPNIDENIYGLMEVEALRYIDTTIPILVVQGLVFNMSRTKGPVPPLVAIVSDATGKELARWKFFAEAPTLQPGESTGFRSETVDPAPNSTNVTVVFASPDEPQIATAEVSILAR